MTVIELIQVLKEYPLTIPVEVLLEHSQTRHEILSSFSACEIPGVILTIREEAQ